MNENNEKLVARIEARKHAEKKIKAYYESRVIRESLKHRLEILNRQRAELVSLLQDDLDAKSRNTLNDDLSLCLSQIAAKSTNIRLIERQYAETEFYLSGLCERDREIIKFRYRKKKTFRSISFDFYLSESQVCKICHAVLEDFSKFLADADQTPAQNVLTNGNMSSFLQI